MKKIIILASFFFVAFASLACEGVKLNALSSDVSILFFERDSYNVVSNEAKELLSCGPMAVAIGREMTVTYLADEESPIETETSKSIFLRASRFSLDDVGNSLSFIDVAKANTSLFGRAFDSQIPYEPNLINVGDSSLICFYREGGISGVYACCDINPSVFECSNYRYLTLDGRVMNPTNVISSYRKIASREAQYAQLIFTTRIIKEDNSFYGYLGGYGFNGILMRSQNGVDWDSITSPDLPDGMSYIIEGAIGKDPQTGNIFLCGRGDDIMFCGYNKDFEQIIPSRLLPGTTTSKPTMFTYHNRLFLIVNMQNDVEYSIGRRNTANIYRINGTTGDLSLVKTMKCKDGCAYHSVQVVDDEIWVVFQTDGRHIALEDQGRSNLALVKLLLT